MRDMRTKIINLPNTVKKSIADQIKLLSWAIGGINVYFRHELGNFLGVLFVILGWVWAQTVAHYIIYSIKEKKGAEE